MKQALEYLALLGLLTLAACAMLWGAGNTSGVASLYLATAGWTAIALVWHHPLSIALTAAQRAVNAGSPTHA